VKCQERMCYELLARGVGERQIAAETNLDVLEVREVADRHNITTHL
jgi:cytidylate kinase